MGHYRKWEGKASLQQNQKTGLLQIAVKYTLDPKKPASTHVWMKRVIYVLQGY